MRHVPSMFTSLALMALSIASTPSCSGSSNGTNGAVGGDTAATGGSLALGGTGTTGGTSGGNASGGATRGIAATGASNSGTSPACPSVQPDATNTGVPPGVALTVVNQDVNITLDGTVIDAEDIHGFVVVSASHVTIKRSIVRGGMATANGDGIRVALSTFASIGSINRLARPEWFLSR